MEYDTALFESFKALAVTDAANLKPGQTYFTNNKGDFVFERLATNQERYDENGLQYGEGGNEIGWIKTSNGFMSLTDNNIGASYNPWLIFEHKGLAEACADMLKITYTRDWMDEFYYEEDWA